MTTSAPGTGPRGRGQARKVGQALGTGARGTGRAVAATARVTGRFSRFTMRQARRASSAEGADKSGLSRLIEMHVFNTAGDAAVAISLAGTLFFQVPTGEARGQVALFLALTMLPFAIVAPLLGPFLDRFSHGRRWAIGATMAIRAFLVWGLATAVTTESTWLFPLALGCLVSSKAYGVTRAAAVPRLLPESLTLVKANGRISLAGVVGASDLGAHRRAGVRLRGGVVAALRIRAVRAGHDLGDPAARTGRLRRRRGPGRADRLDQVAQGPSADAHPRHRRRSRCAPTAGRAGCRAS